MTARRPFEGVDFWEHRDDRGPADQATGGVIHPNGTRIVSADHDFLAACLRTMLGTTKPRRRKKAA